MAQEAEMDAQAGRPLDDLEAVQETDFMFYLNGCHVSFPRIYDFGIRSGNYCMLLEYNCAHSLDYFIAKAKIQFDHELVRHISRQLVEACECLRQYNVVHCDIAPRNVLIMPLTGNIKLIDFGKMRWSGTRFGMPNDMPLGTWAPEVRHAPMTCKADIYSVAVTIYMVAFSGKVPFHFTRDPDNENFLGFPDGAPFTMADFLTRTMCRQVVTRLSAEQALRHPFISAPVGPFNVDILMQVPYEFTEPKPENEKFIGQYSTKFVQVLEALIAKRKQSISQFARSYNLQQPFTSPKSSMTNLEQ